MEELERKLLVYMLGVNLAGLCFAAAALLAFGPLHAVAAFTVAVTVLLAVVYRKNS